MTEKNTEMRIPEFELAKEHVSLRLVNRAANEEKLKKMPHICKADMAIIFCLVWNMEENRQLSAEINNNMAEHWKLTVSELFELALKNSPQLLPVKCRTLRKVLAEEMLKTVGNPAEIDLDAMEEDTTGREPYVLTNQMGLYGAAVILYPDVLNRIALEWDSDLLILPSSVHETILMRYIEDADMESVRDMVVDINRTKVEAEDVLSNQIYIFCRKDGVIRIVGNENQVECDKENE